MARIEWNAPGERRFEAGVDRGVMYPKSGVGVAWNGLVSISEATTGGDPEALYFDGIKYLDIIASEDFAATLEAYSAPPEFDACDGRKRLAPGLYATQQPRKPFDLCYRTLIGNDLLGEEYGYKIHLVYNCMAAPSDITSQTIAGTPSPSTRSWAISAVPPESSAFRPTAHLVIDSTELDPYVLEDIETFLYGRASDGYLEILPTMPTVQQLTALLDNGITDVMVDFL